jgi:hypothetical protein
MILQQIKAGSTIIKKVVKEDIQNYSLAGVNLPTSGTVPRAGSPEELALQQILRETPIGKFIIKYNPFQTYFKSSHITDNPPEEKTFSVPDQPSIDFYTPIWGDIWKAFGDKGATSDIFNPYSGSHFKRFIYDFFRAYVLQYQIGDATTNQEKTAKLFPYWERYIGQIPIKLATGTYLARGSHSRPQTWNTPTTTNITHAVKIFPLLNITRDKLIAYALDTSVNPALPA